MRKLFFFFVLFFISFSLFPFSVTQEIFYIMNFSSKELLISRQINNFSASEPMLIEINGIDVVLGYYVKEENFLLRPKKNYIELTYNPVAENWDDFSFFLSALNSFSFGEKMKAIFKTFSIRTADGVFIIRDIDDLCSFNIEKNGNTYILAIYDP